MIVVDKYELLLNTILDQLGLPVRLEGLDVVMWARIHRAL